MSRMTVSTAEELARNSRVIRFMGEQAYLVDSVSGPYLDGRLRVNFSSGDEIKYQPNEAVVILED